MTAIIAGPRAGAGYDAWINKQMNDAGQAATAKAEQDGRRAGRAVVLNRLRLASDTLVRGSGDPRVIVKPILSHSMPRQLQLRF
jgi:hypothetical protein